MSNWLQQLHCSCKTDDVVEDFGLLILILLLNLLTVQDFQQHHMLETPSPFPSHLLTPSTHLNQPASSASERYSSQRSATLSSEPCLYMVSLKRYPERSYVPTTRSPQETHRFSYLPCHNFGLKIIPWLNLPKIYTPQCHFLIPLLRSWLTWSCLRFYTCSPCLRDQRQTTFFTHIHISGRLRKPYSHPHVSSPPPAGPRLYCWEIWVMLVSGTHARSIARSPCQAVWANSFTSTHFRHDWRCGACSGFGSRRSAIGPAAFLRFCSCLWLRVCRVLASR